MDKLTMTVAEYEEKYGVTLPSFSQENGVTSDEKMYSLFENRFELSKKDQEHFCLITFDSRLIPIDYHLCAVGKKNMVYLDKALILRKAILDNAISIAVAHNHPSGDPSPSEPDVRLTENLSDACEFLGIGLLDHIIIGQNSFVSLRKAKGNYSGIKWQ